MSLRGAPRARAAAASAIIAVLIGGCDVIAGLGQFDNAVEAIDAVDSGSEIATPGEDGQPAPLASSSAANLSSSTGSSGGASSALATTGAADAFAPDAGASEATPDAASDSADAAMVDAAAVTPADAGPPSDAGATWCVEHASPVTFDCHDFDDAASPLAGFTSHFFSGNFASVTSTDYAPGSAPSSLLIATPALDGGSSAINQFNDVLLYHDKLELAFSLKLVSYDSNAGDVSLFRVSYQDNGWAETLDSRGSTATLNEVWPLSNRSLRRRNSPGLSRLPRVWNGIRRLPSGLPMAKLMQVITALTATLLLAAATRQPSSSRASQATSTSAITRIASLGVSFCHSSQTTRLQSGRPRDCLHADDP